VHTVLDQIDELAPRLQAELSMLDALATMIVAMQHRRRTWNADLVARICRRSPEHIQMNADVLSAARQQYRTSLESAQDMARLLNTYIAALARMRLLEECPEEQARMRRPGGMRNAAHERLLEDSLLPANYDRFHTFQ
jgi:hypothetical protein